jgi:hypothetical protein
MSGQQKSLTKLIKRLSLGILLGAICGAVLVSWCLKLPTIRQTVGTYVPDFAIAFGNFFGEHIFAILTSLGAVVGSAIGGSLAVSKRWCSVLLTFIAGIAIGGTTMFFVEVKVVKWVSGLWEQGYSDERAFTYLQCLKAIDRGITNQLYLVRFQNNGRMALTNYVREMENLKAGEYGAFSGTNAPAYGMARKYLATHTNSLPIGSDF